METFFNYVISLAVSSSSLPYISNYYYDSQYEWLKISISKNNTTKVCGNIDISKTNLQYKLLCGKENGKGLIPLDKIKFITKRASFLHKVPQVEKCFFQFPARKNNVEI